MKKTILFILLQAFWVAGFSQSLPPEFNRGIFFHPTNLIVNWKVPKHPWPEKLSVLRMVPTKYSATVMSNLMAPGSFTEQDLKYQDTNGFRFNNGRDELEINTSEGDIEFWKAANPTNLARNVPTTNQLVQLLTNFLPKIGINMTNIARDKKGNADVNWWDDTVYIYPPHTNVTDFVIITNVPFRAIHFHRAIDGVKFFFGGGDGEVDFGENGEVIKMMLMWPGYEPGKLYSIATPEKIIQWIREGRAMQKRAIRPDGSDAYVIDWSKAKSLTIQKATAYYYGQFFERGRSEQPVFPSWAQPYAELSGIVDTGVAKIPVDIDCPLIDEK